jgi:hypothetical protein
MGSLLVCQLGVQVRGIPHLARNERDAPNFLDAAPDKAASAPFFKEGRMKFRESTKLLRKSGMWGTQGQLQGKVESTVLSLPGLRRDSERAIGRSREPQDGKLSIVWWW